MAEPQVTRAGLMDMQVCVPRTWNDEQVLGYAKVANPCGTENGWQIRRKGNPLLAGAAERTECAKHPNNIHIMLDA